MKLIHQLLGLFLGFVIGILSATTALAAFGLYIYTVTDPKKSTKRSVYTKRDKSADPLAHTYQNRLEAEDMVDYLMAILGDRGSVTIHDLKTKLDIPSAFSDYKHGWKNLSGFSILKLDEQKYTIKFPNVEAL